MCDTTRYRNALLWAFDRLSVDGDMTAKEQRTTQKEIGQVLLGKPSRAAAYDPDEWADSAQFSPNRNTEGTD